MCAPRIAALLAVLSSAGAVASPPQPAFTALEQRTFTPARTGELVAKLTVRCDACAWDVEGREAVVLTAYLDSRPAIALPITRTGRAEYRLMLGAAGAGGSYTLHIDEDASLTARDLRARDAAVVEEIVIEELGAPIAHVLAPVLYARPDTIGRFTDVPLFMWYETEPTPRGTRYRYSVIFSNEDGGTPADRLMATWGRTTDIEYVYSVEVDARGAVLHEDMQGPKHEVLPFRGKRDGTHPILYVSTSNNMVLDEGTPRVKYAPVPVAFPLDNVSREAVMDAHPWLYEVMAKELAREGKIADDAPPGKGTVSDPRRHVYLEACGVVGNAALAFLVHLRPLQPTVSAMPALPSDRGIAEYRVVRDGCFRVAVPLPRGVSTADIRAIGVQAFAREGKPAPAGPARLTRVNALFALDDRFEPGPSLLKWEGSAELRPGGPPLEIPVR